MNIHVQQFKLPYQQGHLHAVSWQHAKTDLTLAPIILMHDSLGSTALWRDFPAQLAIQSGRQVYAYDRYGFGLSAQARAPLTLDFVLTEATDAFKALLEYFQFSQFIVLGHSVGGGMSAVIAAEYPQQCQGLITIAAQYEVEELTLNGIREAKVGFQQAEQLERLEKYHPDKAQWVLDAWTETWLSPEFRQWTLASVLHKVICPSLIIHGELDEYGSTAQPQQLFNGVAGQAEMHILEGLHHMPHKEQPELVQAIICEFLEELEC
ncbi:alpha/beta fold hydrolase [Acinetobacter tianfuensis]|uniref:Alpha/beta hydrolase n=1 Tax=Acinetobacter tianfuensis TaxID=2419603 RepID=A0A3A8EDR8_9GAMM|nr:alpha/beta hydrolase [Acinetobacter tianfuensis]RKG32258.1 alpha/beta hydrolase [Acinetobacter tianfuensis]